MNNEPLLEVRNLKRIFIPSGESDGRERSQLFHE